MKKRERIERRREKQRKVGSGKGMKKSEKEIKKDN
jgi:hypothetical protein